MTVLAPPTAVVLGPFEQFELELVSHLLRASGTEVVSVAEAARMGGSAVVVLIEPDVAHWETARATEAPIVLITSAKLSDDELVAAVIGGADAVLSADDGVDAMLAALDLVIAGGTVITPEQTRLLVSGLRTKSSVASSTLRLTPRESDILRLVESGQSVKQTARALGISVKTVESIQARLFRKLGVRNRAEALARARTLNLLDTSQPGPSGNGGLANPDMTSAGKDLIERVDP